jgi:hypothetical protein
VASIMMNPPILEYTTLYAWLEAQESCEHKVLYCTTKRSRFQGSGFTVVSSLDKHSKVQNKQECNNAVHCWTGSSRRARHISSWFRCGAKLRENLPRGLHVAFNPRSGRGLHFHFSMCSLLNLFFAYSNFEAFSDDKSNPIPGVK